MTKKAGSAEFQKKIDSIMEHCADRREWEGVRIGNLSREDAVSLFGENVVAGLDKKAFDVNCPFSSDESYTDPDAREEKNPDLEFHAAVECKDTRGRKLGTLIHVKDCDRQHYLFDRVEMLTREQKIKRALREIHRNNDFILGATRENEQLAKQLERLIKKRVGVGKVTGRL